MKKIIGIILFIIIGTNLQAGFGRLDFVATNHGIYYFKNVRHGFSAFLIGIEENGEMRKFSKTDIIAYTKNGKQYEKMPLFDKNKNYKGDFFMELVKTENGVKVYKHNTFDKETDQFHYLVFRNKTYLGEIKNLKNISRFY